jgi:hypothetical protein
VNGSVVIKDSAGGEHTFVNASIVSVNNGTIIIETKWKPKKGELVKMEGNGTNGYAIFKNIEGSLLHDYGYKFFRDDRLICNPYGYDARNVTISPVTPEEQKHFDDFCKSQGMIWNKETLQWEEYRWKPKDGDIYYHVDLELGDGVGRHTYMNDSIDQCNYKHYNCFRTKKQAQEAAEKVKELLN